MKTAAMTALAWTERQDQILRDNPDLPDTLLSERVSLAGPERTRGAVQQRRVYLGMKRSEVEEWSTDRVEKLKALHARGYSASQIAAELGGIGRSAVIGKTHRLGLSRPDRAKLTQSASAHVKQMGRKPRHPMAPKGKPTPPAPTAAARNFQHGCGCVVELVPRDAAPIKTQGPLPDSKNLPMWHPGFGGCRYATSGESAREHLFCCLPVEEGTPYCAGHGAVCRTPVPSVGRKSASELARGLRRFA